MKIWLITQGEVSGYDTFDSAVVFAEDENFARMMHPRGDIWPDWPFKGAWAADPSHVSVQYVGKADRPLAPGVLLASFNAG